MKASTHLTPALRGEFFGQDEGARSSTLTDRVFSISGALHDQSELHLGRRVALQLSPRLKFGALTLTIDESGIEDGRARSSFILAKKLNSETSSHTAPRKGEPHDQTPLLR